MGMGGAGSVGAGDDARGPAGTSSASLLSMSVVDRLYSEAERKEVRSRKAHLSRTHHSCLRSSSRTAFIALTRLHQSPSSPEILSLTCVSR